MTKPHLYGTAKGWDPQNGGGGGGGGGSKHAKEPPPTKNCPGCLTNRKWSCHGSSGKIQKTRKPQCRVCREGNGRKTKDQHPRQGEVSTKQAVEDGGKNQQGGKARVNKG